MSTRTDPPDAATRAAAMDPRRNVVLEASAGTGKTSVLVGRYLNLLRAGVAPRHILALTFTRKAAAEMRQRIVGDLRSAASRSAHDAAIWRDLQERIGDINIGTIDAFCLSLLREFPLEAGLDPGFSMIDETEAPPLIDTTLDRAMRTGRALVADDPDVALVFARLRPRQIRAGLGHLLGRRLVAPAALERLLRHAPRTLTGESACRRAIGGLADALDATGRGRFTEDGPLAHPGYASFAEDLARLDEIAAAEAGVMRRTLDQARDYFLTRAGHARARVTAYRADQCASRPAWRRHADAVRTAAPLVAETLRRLDRDLSLVLARGVRRLMAVAIGEYARTLEAHGQIDFSDALARALALLGQMDEFAQSRFRLESRYHHVLVDEFQDTSRAQWHLLSLLIQSWGEGFGLVHEAPLPPSIFVVGDRKQSIYRFRDAEVAVLDEAARQIDALRPGTGTRRFISTSFRSTPDILTFVNDVFGLVDTLPDRTDAFRFGADDRFPIEAMSDADVAASDDHAGSPRASDAAVGLVVQTTMPACAAAIAGEIDRLLRHGTVRDRDTGEARAVRPGDVAVLFRTRESHREIEDALVARGISAHVYKGLGFFDADEVQDLLALVRYLAEPDSDLAAAALLRSRLVRLSDHGLASLAPGLAAALAADDPPAALPALSAEDRATLALARRSLRAWLPLVDREPPAELLDRALRESAYAFELRGPRRVQARENVKKLRALARRIQNKGYTTMRRLAERIARLSTGDEANAVVDAIDAVNLMTVHAAKGLEFPVAFVANMARGVATSVPPLEVLSANDQEEPVVAVGTLDTESLEEERLRDREETKRLLYVALTRARDRLYLSAVVPEARSRPARGSLAEVLPGSLWDVLRDAGSPGASDGRLSWTGPSATHRIHVCRLPDTGDTPVAVASDVLAEAAPIDALQPLDVGEPAAVSVTAVIGAGDGRGRGPADSLGDEPDSETSVGRDDQASDGQDDEADERRVGALVHRLVQFAPLEPETERSIRLRAVALLRLEDDAPGSPDAVVDGAVQVYRALRDDPDARSALFGRTRRAEVPFSMRTAADAPVVRGLIDALVRHDDGALEVVELKTGRARMAHERQIALYVDAVRRIHPGVAVTATTIHTERTAGGVAVHVRRADGRSETAGASGPS